MDVSSGMSPPGAPPGGSWVEEKYAGKITWIVIVLTYIFLLLWYACLFLKCPLDARRVYLAPNGAKYDEMGTLIS